MKFICRTRNYKTDHFFVFVYLFIYRIPVPGITESWYRNEKQDAFKEPCRCDNFWLYLMAHLHMTLTDHFISLVI